MLWNQVLHEIVYPVIGASIPALVALGFAWVTKQLGLQALAAQNMDARQAVQGAIATFAGHVLSDLEAGRVTMTAVRNGAVAKDLVDYAASTVGDSMTHLGVTPDVLGSMLVSKVAVMSSMAPAVPTVTVTVPVTDTPVPPVQLTVAG